MVRIGWNRLSSSVDTTGIFYQIFSPKSNLGRKPALSTLPLYINYLMKNIRGEYEKHKRRIYLVKFRNLV